MRSLSLRALVFSMLICAVFFAGIGDGALFAQQSGQGKWAEGNDPIAAQLIEQERKWAVLGCVPSDVVAEFVAEDFVGTSPDGPTYTKSDLLAKHEAPSTEYGCKLLSARVRFYGPDLAVIYGRETAFHKNAAGKEVQQTLIWTDTALRRNGKWQLIAVQDMFDPKK